MVHRISQHCYLNQVYLWGVYAAFHICIQLPYGKVLQHLSFLKECVSDGRTYILINHLNAFLLVSSLFCSALRLNHLRPLASFLTLLSSPLHDLCTDLLLPGDQEARRAAGISLLVFCVSSLLQSKHRMQSAEKVCSIICLCSLLSPAFVGLKMLHAEQICKPFLFSINFGCSRTSVLNTPAVQNLGRMRIEEPKELAVLKRWAVLHLAIRRLLFRTKSAQRVCLPRGRCWLCSLVP